MKKMNRIIIKHPKGKVTPKTIAGMLLERVGEFESILVMGIQRSDFSGQADIDFVDWSTLELRDLTYYKSVLEYEVNKHMAVVDE